MLTWTIPLDPFTKPPLTLNEKLHWARANARKNDLIENVFWRAKQQKIPTVDKIAVTLHWLPRVERRRDGDNPFPTIKACVDGLVKAGVVVDDDHTRVVHRGVVFHEIGEKCLSNLWLEIEQLAPATEDAS